MPQNPTAKTMLWCLCAVLAALAAAGLAVILLLWPFERPLPWVLGLLAGGCVSAGKIVLMERSMEKGLDMGREQATNHARLHALLRFFLTVGVILLVVLLRRWVGLIGTFAGILALQLAAILTHLVERRRAPDTLPSPLPDDEDSEPARDSDLPEWMDPT